MIKRIFSKRSGFTLVEILVAFTIFVIMMSMIMQILQLSVAARRENTEMTRERAEQEEQLVIGKDMVYDESAPDEQKGIVELNFGEDQDFKLDYQIKGTDDENPADGLNYFVGNVDYTLESVKGDEQKKQAESGSQMSKYDTRITGTANLGDIKISVEKKTNTKYEFTLTATADAVSDEMKKYAQIRMYFFSNKYYSDVNEYVDGYVSKDAGPKTEEIKTYKKSYVSANIKEVGFLSGGKITKRISKNDSEKEILLQGLGNSVRISYYGGSCFDNSSIKFFVEFNEDIELNAKSFGSNADGDSKTAVYQKYTVKKSKDEVKEEENIYGGMEFTTSDSPFTGSVWVAGKDSWDKNPSKKVIKIDSTTQNPDLPVGGGTPATPVEGGGA